MFHDNLIPRASLGDAPRCVYMTEMRNGGDANKYFLILWGLVLAGEGAELGWTFWMAEWGWTLFTIWSLHYKFSSFSSALLASKHAVYDGSTFFTKWGMTSCFSTQSLCRRTPFYVASIRISDFLLLLRDTWFLVEDTWILREYCCSHAHLLGIVPRICIY